MRLSAIILVALVTFSWAQTVPGTRSEIRALWVTRGEYQSADDVRTIVANASGMNFNVILFQVRGNGTVFYNSKIEPWAFELTSNNPRTTDRDPGWDPLQTAIDEAKARNIELHAWVNVFPAWKSQQFPPRETKQLWWQHPEWLMVDAAGEKMIPRDHRVNPKVADWYSFINPGVPQVREYLARVCEELVTNYAIDGLHYDYIRYPREITEVKPAGRERAKRLGNWSYDVVSLRRFSAETGLKQPEDDPEKWFAWRADQVTAAVTKIAERVRPLRPKMIISAAVGADPVDSRRGKGQSYIEWLDKGLVDAVFLMGYTPDPQKFEKQCALAWAQKPARGYMSAGMGTKYEPDIVAKEIAAARKLGLSGFAAFSYAGLFDLKTHQSRAVAKALQSGAMAEPSIAPWQSR